eukprot:6212849-Pleurochrysis_carterae.AAC.1
MSSQQDCSRPGASEGPLATEGTAQVVRKRPGRHICLLCPTALGLKGVSHSNSDDAAYILQNKLGCRSFPKYPAENKLCAVCYPPLPLEQVIGRFVAVEGDNGVRFQGLVAGPAGISAAANRGTVQFGQQRHVVIGPLSRWQVVFKDSKDAEKSVVLTTKQVWTAAHEFEAMQKIGALQDRVADLTKIAKALRSKVNAAVLMPTSIHVHAAVACHTNKEATGNCKRELQTTGRSRLLQQSASAAAAPVRTGPVAPAAVTPSCQPASAPQATMHPPQQPSVLPTAAVANLERHFAAHLFTTPPVVVAAPESQRQVPSTEQPSTSACHGPVPTPTTMPQPPWAYAPRPLSSTSSSAIPPPAPTNSELSETASVSIQLLLPPDWQQGEAMHLKFPAAWWEEHSLPFEFTACFAKSDKASQLCAPFTVEVPLGQPTPGVAVHQREGRSAEALRESLQKRAAELDLWWTPYGNPYNSTNSAWVFRETLCFRNLTRNYFALPERKKLFHRLFGFDTWDDAFSFFHIISEWEAEVTASAGPQSSSTTRHTQEPLLSNWFQFLSALWRMRRHKDISSLSAFFGLSDQTMSRYICST